MDSWGAPHSPNLKFEPSPAESFLSTPGDMYPPLFAAPITVSPLDTVSPAPSEYKDVAAEATPEATPEVETPDKKPAKKRKSWGQVLPEPKTSLPPRKRAKTEDEKEQRRVERVLRNRRAAQSSRERKRQEVEALELRNQQLEAMLKTFQQTNLRLLEELQRARRDAGVATSLRPAAVTFSQELFSSHDARPPATAEPAGSIEDLLASVQQAPPPTVNPASLSPVPELDEPALAEPAAAAPTSPDATQHPAAVLCPDLQCRSAEVARPAPSALHPALAFRLPLHILLTSSSMMLLLWQRLLMPIVMSWRAGFCLHPAPSILATTLWLVTTPATSRRRRTTMASTPKTSSTTLTCPSSSPTSAPPRRRRPRPASPPRTTLRLALLRKILTCSPTLARPLMDATMAALRWVAAEERGAAGSNAGGRDATGALALEGWPAGVALPSKEALITLFWVLRLEARRGGLGAAVST